MPRIIYVLMEMEYGGEFIPKGVTSHYSTAKAWENMPCRHYLEFVDQE